ncbi:MAG: phosphoribosylamine--glycine ligase [Clostridiaceae bacterium]|nr:phosphoribosylamine--glycine ligase [Clostridiaceae bacterium]
MKVLVVGGGGREHALVWKVSRSPLVSEVYCAPGNGGISRIAACIPVKAMDIEGIVTFSKKNNIDLVVVSPDDPLAAGMVNALQDAGIRAFGPVKEAAVIESSKVFAKNLMKKYKIPTARHEVFNSPDKAIKYARKQKYPLVIKADGLAAGKGVIIAGTYDMALDAIHEIMEKKIFGESGSRIVIEEYLEGKEATVLAFTDGNTLVPMVSSQDHKKAYDYDLGPNTGGMGAFSPSRHYNERMAEICQDGIFLPTIHGMRNEGIKFKGVLYFGLMLTDDGPRVLEYNARFGDPEAQVVLPRLKNDIVEIFEAIIDERLDKTRIEWDDRAAACIIAASDGYPGMYRTGFEISGIEEAEKEEDVMVFHAGTRHENGKYYTAGGRVLGVTALGNTLETAINKAYNGIMEINFQGMHYRKDIGMR